MTVRLRFAPSPTGYMHLGNARTALFNWLYARHMGGKFLLRIEDTDRERHTEDAVEVIYDSLRWMGLDWDEDVIFQSDRFDHYKAVAEKMVEDGLAYRCNMTRDALEAAKEAMLEKTGQRRYDRTNRDANLGPDCGEHVIRFKAPLDGESTIEDIIQGTIIKQQVELDDFIILRSDGTPTYQFAVVVDDHEMEITHVVRGADHIDNTHDQLNLYHAFGWTPPRFAHAPRILGLSKRKGSPSVEYYRDELGLLREGLVNYLVRLGWSHGDQELFTMDELIAAFDLADCNQANANFDDQKLTWVNEQQLRSLPIERVAEAALPWFQKEGLEPELGDYFYKLLEPLRLRASKLSDLAPQARYFFEDFDAYDEKAAKKNLKLGAAPLLEELADSLSQIETWDEASIETAMTSLCEAHELKLGKIAQPTRVAISGRSMTPGIYETVLLVGQQRCVDRLRAAAVWIRENRG